METFLLKNYSVFLFFQCMIGVMGLVVLGNLLILLLRELYLTWREKKAKQKEGCQQQEKTTWKPEPPVLLTPKERREYMLNHIEDGRFYVVSSLRNSDTTIVCAKRYDAEKQMLYCYYYLWIRGCGVYNLHIIDPRGIFKLRDFLGNKPLSIDFDRNPNLIIFEEENISQYLTERDYNDIVQSLQKAGVECEIERSEENILGSYKYQLKVNKNKITNTTSK